MLSEYTGWLLRVVHEDFPWADMVPGWGLRPGQQAAAVDRVRRRRATPMIMLFSPSPSPSRQPPEPLHRSRVKIHFSGMGECDAILDVAATLGSRTI